MAPKVFPMVFNNQTTLCGPNILGSISSVWQGDNPLMYMFPVFSLQVSISTFFTASAWYLLKPFGQTSFVSYLIGGLVAGPPGLGRTKLFREDIFDKSAIYMFETFQFFGVMFFLFLVGVKTDLGMIKKSGKKAWVIGLSCFFLPLVLTLSIASIVQKSVQMDPNIARSLPFAASLMSLTSFHVIACFLADLNLLNSELGRLAMSASMISGLCSWATALIGFTSIQSFQTNKPHTFPWIMLSCCGMLMFIVYVLRPIMFWIIRHTPADKNVKEGYIFFIFVMVLVCSFFGEVAGQHYLIGPMMLGLAVPVGPPLGAAIEDKLECFITTLLLPILIIAMSCRTNIFNITFENFAIIEFVVLISFLGKFIGAVLPALYCRMQYQDALLLGLIMNVQGVFDLQFWFRALAYELIDPQVYSGLIISMVIITGTISPVVKILYNPSRRYIAYKRRTVQHTKSNAELRILACIYHDQNVPTILKLLEASHPTTYSPICVYVLHLIQLQGRASSLLVAHKRNPKDPSHFGPSSHIINAFRFYENHNQGAIYVNSFTAISPYTTMHDDICALGLERRTSLIIVPFHHQPTVTSTLHSPTAIRKVNQNILNKAPCSVGILIDRGSTTAAASAGILGNRNSYCVGVIFLGGADDREALAYGARMGEDENVNLTVFRFIIYKEKIDHTTNEKKQDYDEINEFRINSVGNKNIVYREEVVKDGIELVSTIRSMEKSFELLMVGRQHGEESSQLLRGLEEWNEFPELGLIGDLLATSDSGCTGSVLVVQQQPCTNSSLLDSPKYHFGNVI
ncbi:Cation/H+ exchanger [Macleaya cordata]|uniref:Cation/H+ exchanger n=1 Tax=Macleaya cordata TaxID=56857 RepID=A0A200QQD2_MACCD|nr:Cation/H+ exchanger [Macleaya cordata]